MKRWSTVAGSVFAALIMGLVLYLYGSDLKKIDVWNPVMLPKLAAAVAIYVLVMVIAAFGWKAMLTALGATPAPCAAERQMLISQIGKYIPGNVAQYLGRAAMAIHSGTPTTIVAVALVADTAAIVAAGLVAVAVPAALSPNLANSLPLAFSDQSPLWWLGFAIAVFFVMLLCLNLTAVLFDQLKRLPRIRPAWIFVAFVLYILSFLLLGLSLHFVVISLTAAPVPLWLSIEVFAAGWIAGLVTPGAPGGLGVRESVLTLGLAPILGGAGALSAALLHRGVSVLGDVISFGIGQILPKEASRPT